MLRRGRGVDRVTHGRVGPLILGILRPHWSGVTRVRAPIGHWSLVMGVRRMGVARVTRVMRMART